jgi:hypothetical protein
MMTSHFHVHTAIARQIVGGEFDKSIQSLSDYLVSLRDEMEMTEPVDEYSKSSTEEQNDRTSRFEIVSWTTEEVITASQTSRDDIPVFREPLLVRCIDGLVPLETFTFVGMYNLALAYHLKFLHSKTDREKESLHKAARLYEMAHEVSHNLGIHVPPVHLLSLVTNLANVHRTLGDEKKVKACLQHALCIYMFIVHSITGKELTTSLGRFLQYVLPAIFSKSDAAPAA